MSVSAIETAGRLNRLLTTRVFGALRLLAGIVLLAIGLLLVVFGVIGRLGITRKIEYVLALSAIALYFGARLLYGGSVSVLLGSE